MHIYTYIYINEAHDSQLNRKLIHQDPSFPLRSVPDSLKAAAEESFKKMEGEGLSKQDLMEAGFSREMDICWPYAI